MKIAIALIVLLAAAAPAVAQYKWIDANGRVMYGDNPPRDAKNIEKLGAAAPDSDDPLRTAGFELRRAAQAHPVVLYTSANCGPCESARQLLRARGVPYTEKTVATQADADALKNLGGGNQVPVLAVGRQVQQLFETGTWHALLDTAGYPRTSQLPRGWQAPAPTPLVPPPAEPKAAEPKTADAVAPRTN